MIMEKIHLRRLYNKTRNVFKVIHNAITGIWAIYSVDIFYGDFWNFREYIIKNDLIDKNSREEKYYWNYLESKNSFVGLHAQIMGVPILPHGLNGIFISESAIIGHKVTIYQQVTIGSNLYKDSKHFGAPKIGDNCVLGAGAILVGNIKVGDNCRIGAGTVVYKDIPDNSTVVSKHLDIISHGPDLKDNTFIPNTHK